MALTLRKTPPTSFGGSRPATAVEVAPEGALAATRTAAGQAFVHAFAPLAAGALVPGIAEANLRNPAAVADAVRSALDQVSPKKSDITLIVPDWSTRVFVLDFDSLPNRPAETISVLRFRLRKMVPLDVETAAVSYQVLPELESGTVRVLATVMPGTILAEYETAVRAAGYEPGAVMPSSLAALASVVSPEPALTVNLAANALTTSVIQGDDLLLFRTVDLPTDNAARVGEVQRSIAVAVAWFEDHLKVAPRQLYYSGGVDVREFSRAIQDAGLSVEEIAPTPTTGGVTPVGPIGFAGVTGALAGAA